MDSYKTISENKTGEGYYTEKRSKFLAFAHHVETADDVKEIVAQYRKKYFDARHVCWAYMLGHERNEFRANDDGEPSSTAGKPILGQINSRELTNILVSAAMRKRVVDVAIHDADFLLEEDERYGGFQPRRTFKGYRYQEQGFSDHLPLIMHFK